MMKKNKMNFLENRSVYLAGSIENADDDGLGWREKLTPILENFFGVEVFNPLYKDEYFKMLNTSPETDTHLRTLRDEGKFDEYKEAVEVIVHCDLRLVDKSDFLIVGHDPDIASCGTWWECAVADSQRMPVIVLTTGEKKDIPGWLWGIFPHETFFDDMDDMLDYLEQINNGDIDEPNSDRWLL